MSSAFDKRFIEFKMQASSTVDLQLYRQSLLESSHLELRRERFCSMKRKKSIVMADSSFIE